VVIGAGAGIGNAAAHRLVKEGAHIVCVDLDEAAAKETAQEIVKNMGRVSELRARASATVGRQWLSLVRHHQSRERRPDVR